MKVTEEELFWPNKISIVIHASFLFLYKQSQSALLLMQNRIPTRGQNDQRNALSKVRPFTLLLAMIKHVLLGRMNVMDI